jgi:hypothetical protein
MTGHRGGLKPVAIHLETPAVSTGETERGEILE